MKNNKLRLLLSLLILLLLIAQRTRAQSPWGNALSFSGTNQYVTVPNFGNIIPTNEITVEFWADTSKFAGQSAFMLSPDQNYNRFNVHLDYGTGYADALTYWDFGNITGGGRISVSAPPNSVGNWVFYTLVASQSGNYMAIYTNGVLQFQQSGMTPFVRGNYSLQIGGPGYAYNGALDELRIWSVARTAAQIQSDLYTPPTGDEPNLVAYYKFDSGSGNVAVNSAGTGPAYNGILTNSPAWVASTIPAPTIIVTSADDSGPGTLRQAVLDVTNGAYITFAPNLAGQTITLTNGQIELTTNVTIDASALPGGMIISGNYQSRIFQVGSNATVVLDSLTLTEGNGGDNGGGIYNSGILTVNECSLVLCNRQHFAIAAV